MSNFGKGGTSGDSFLAVEECGSDSGFRGGQHNIAHDLGDSMDGAVEGRIGVGSTVWVRGAVSQEVVPAGAAPGLLSEILEASLWTWRIISLTE